MMYAPVRRLSEVTVKNGRLSGQAYPEAGEPCAIELVSGPHVIGAVRAERIADRKGNGSKNPEGFGFGIDLRPADFVFSDELVLRCAVSHEVLHVVHFGAVEWPAPPEVVEVSVAHILAADRAEIPAPDMEADMVSGEGLAAEQFTERLRRLMFPGLTPADFQAFIGALEPASTERAVLLALAELRASAAPDPVEQGLPRDPRRPREKPWLA
jgi:hypothetical protein